jgi:hypothetical protein
MFFLRQNDKEEGVQTITIEAKFTIPSYDNPDRKKFNFIKGSTIVKKQVNITWFNPSHQTCEGG